MAKRTIKRLKFVALAALALVVGTWLLMAILLQHWTAKPPPLPTDTSIMQLTAQVRGEKTWLGKSWAGKRDGLLVVHLKGSPFEIGYADGVLMQEQMHTLENEFLKMIQEYVPRHWVMELLKDYVIYRNRHLTDYTPLSYRLELFGTTLGCRDIHPEEGSYYNRLLNYHAAHDVSYMMIDNPLISRAGCTSFGAWGSATEKGHLLTARNFDWEAAEVFSRDRVVMLCEPDDGIPFISLSWAGMAGVVSGMNRAGISVTLNGAPSSLPRETATPVAMVARDVLQKAHNLEETLAILRRAKVFVSTVWLVGSRADGKFIVIEKTPEVMQVREPESDLIVAANHFQTPGLHEDARSKAYIEDSTSVSRAQRMTELLQQERGGLNPASAAKVLRDRNLPGGMFAGNGHRGTLNAFIATHATIMDLTDGIFWAASPPNQLGKFVPFDIHDFDRELPERTVAPDGTLVSGEFNRARQAQQTLKEGRQSLDRKDARAALSCADKAESLNPGFYQNAALQARALMALGQHAEAAKALTNALAARPAFGSEKRQLEALLQQAREGKP